jgi:hypothetical protein
VSHFGCWCDCRLCPLCYIIVCFPALREAALVSIQAGLLSIRLWFPCYRSSLSLSQSLTLTPVRYRYVYTLISLCLPILELQVTEQQAHYWRANLLGGAAGNKALIAVASAGHTRPHSSEPSWSCFPAQTANSHGPDIALGPLTAISCLPGSISDRHMVWHPATSGPFLSPSGLPRVAVPHYTSQKTPSYSN